MCQSVQEELAKRMARQQPAVVKRIWKLRTMQEHRQHKLIGTLQNSHRIPDAEVLRKARKLAFEIDHLRHAANKLVLDGTLGGSEDYAGVSDLGILRVAAQDRRGVYDKFMRDETVQSA